MYAPSIYRETTFFDRAEHFCLSSSIFAILIDNRLANYVSVSRTMFPILINSYFK